MKTKEEIKQCIAKKYNFDSFELVLRYTFNRELLQSEEMFIKKLFDDAMDEAITEHEASQWKKYPENKPEKDGNYNVQHKSGRVYGGIYENNHWLFYNDSIIAFRPLPAPYVKGGDNV